MTENKCKTTIRCIHLNYSSYNILQQKFVKQNVMSLCNVYWRPGVVVITTAHLFTDKILSSGSIQTWMLLARWQRFVIVSTSDSSCLTEAVIRRCSVKKVFLKISQNSQENTCATVPFFFQTCIFIKKETLTHVFCCKFCDIFQNTFFYRTPLVALLFLKHWLGLEIKLKVFRWLTILQNNSSSWSMKVKLVFEWF